MLNRAAASLSEINCSSNGPLLYEGTGLIITEFHLDAALLSILSVTHLLYSHSFLKERACRHLLV